MKIIDRIAFEEAQYMAQQATCRRPSRVSKAAYWEAAMLALREAYHV